MKPQIVAPEYGRHNEQLDSAIARVKKSASWKKLDTIMIVPAGGSIPAKVVQSWLNLYTPPNNKFFRVFALGMEVGEAYSSTIQNILSHPELSQFKYILTVEHDNIPPPDGIVKLLEQMEKHKQYACIGGLYWTKGDLGVPQIWGDPKDQHLNFRPQTPIPNSIQECCGTGMGFNIFRLEMFKDKRLRKPWFKTNTTNGCATQDLYFWEDARKHGYRCAIDTSIHVGHYDLESDIVW